MVLTKANDGRWIVKKKFTFAAVVLLLGSLIALKGFYLAGKVDEIVLVLGAFGTFTSFVLGIVFAADVADKRFNGGEYTANN